MMEKRDFALIELGLMLLLGYARHVSERNEAPFLSHEMEMSLRLSCPDLSEERRDGGAEAPSLIF